MDTYNKVIYKYPININGTIFIVPRMHKILSIQKQDLDMCVWILCDLRSATDTKIRIFCYSTGWVVKDEPGEYISTVQDGEMVWHFFKEEL
jgi:hypothetical protein